jgi:hypothetical protein
MSIKMTDRQRQLMTAAVQRKDRLLTIPPDLKGAAVAKVATALIAGGMAEETKAKAGAPAWRHEAGSDQSCALKLTAAGVKAISDVGEGKAIAHDASGLNHHETPRRALSASTREAATDSKAVTESQPWGEKITLALRAPRAGSKLDRIIGLLSSSEGATIDDLTRTTNWLPHTARAALTGLRKRYEVRLDRGIRDRPSVYRIGALLSPEAMR